LVKTPIVVLRNTIQHPKRILKRFLLYNVADFDPHLIHPSLNRLHRTNHSKRQLDRFTHFTQLHVRNKFPIGYHGMPNLPLNRPFPIDDFAPSNMPILQQTQLITPNGIQIQSAILPQYTFWTTDRLTDRWARRQVCSRLCTKTCSDYAPYLIHDLLFLPISTIESAVGYTLITHCCVSRLACLRLSGHIEPHLPDFKREINTTTTVMN